MLRHWFVPEGGSKAALRTHAILRLWWAAHLTCAPWKRDPELAGFKSADRFRFTRILLRRQQIYFDLVKRDYGSDLRLRICVIEALERHWPSVSWRDTLSREASKRINLLVKHCQIASFDLESLRKTCDSLIGDVATSIAKDAASPSPAAPASATE